MSAFWQPFPDGCEGFITAYGCDAVSLRKKFVLQMCLSALPFGKFKACAKFIVSLVN